MLGCPAIPSLAKEVLHLDVVASITTRGYHAMLALQDKVAVAWRSDPTPGAGEWAGRLALVAGCSRSTVFNRRAEWRRKYGIDIAFPLQMYSDILYFGHNSLAKPATITALMVAVDREEGDEAVRLHADAIADFERKRVEIVNPALVSRPRAMELKLPQIASRKKLSQIASPELDELDDPAFVDFDDVDLVEAVPTRPVSARPVLAPASAKSNAPQVRKGLATRPGTKVVLRVRPSPSPLTTKSKITLRVRRSPPPPTTRNKVILRASPAHNLRPSRQARPDR